MFIADNLAEMRPFFIEFEQTYLHGDMLLEPDSDQPPALLFIDGIGESEERSQFSVLRQVLLKRHHISSCAFDSIGNGNTGGNWKTGSLQHRILQAGEVIDACFDSKPFSIIAIGIGAYAAIRLLDSADVKHLILLSPILYDPCFSSSPLGDLPTDPHPIVRPNRDKYDPFPHIQTFSGKICCVLAENETVGAMISAETLQTYAKGAILCQKYTIPHSSHPIMQAISRNPSTLSNVAGMIAGILAP